jgi:peptidoglycan lytic transglycosylase
VNHWKNTIPIIRLTLLLVALLLPGCSVLETGWSITKGTVKGGYYVIKGAYHLTAGVTKVVYHIGKFTFNVVRAPLDWPLTHDEIETIDGLPVKEAIRLDRVKASPYVVKGRRYVPMTMEEAQNYEETGVASWYGYETRNQKGGHMTANGEAFDPKGLTAAHKYLPLPINVKVTNLENGRSIIVRVNDRGPFPSDNNSRSGRRIIDLSSGAAKRLGFHRKGLTKVHVEVIPVKVET